MVVLCWWFALASYCGGCLLLILLVVFFWLVVVLFCGGCVVELVTELAFLL